MQDERIVRPVSTGRRLFNTEDFGGDKGLVTTSTEGCTAHKVSSITNGMFATPITVENLAHRVVYSVPSDRSGGFLAQWFSRFANYLPGLY